MKRIVVKCSLEDANFIVNNIIPVEKSTRDLEVEMPVEVDENCSDVFKFLSSRKDIVMDWWFEGERIVEHDPEMIEEKDIEEEDIEKEEHVEESREEVGIREVISRGIIINTPFELNRYITFFCKLYKESPALLPFTTTWEKKYQKISIGKELTYSEDNLRKCKKILEVWSREDYPMMRVGTIFRGWLKEVAEEPVSTQESFIINQFLDLLKG